MIKKLFAILFFGSIITVQAQDKVMDLKFKEKHRYLNNFFTGNGMSYVVTGNDKSSKTDLNILCFDSIFNLKFSKDLLSNYKGLPAFFGRGASDPQIFYKMTPTANGKYAISDTDDLVFDSNGSYKKFNLEKGDNLKDFETKFYIYNDKYACYFGYKKLNEKKKKISDETYLCKVNLNDLSKNFIEIKFPPFPSLIKGEMVKKNDKEETKQQWGIASYDDKQFFMINKMSSKDHSEDQYNIVSFDYEGNVISSLSIPLKLKNKYFALSDTGFGSKTIILSPNVGVGLMDESATGNIYVEGNNVFYYVYGLYSNSKISNINKVDYNGFYIYKYNAKGELIWKTEKEIVDKNGFNLTQRPIAVEVNFVKFNDQIGLRISSFYEKYGHMFLVDSKEGKILKNQKSEFKIEGNRLEGISGGAFPTGYAMKEVFENKHMDFNSIFASFLSPKVEKFLKNPSKDDLNYNCELTQNGIYIIEENTKVKAFKLLKFDW